jgi:hypothetical protein
MAARSVAHDSPISCRCATSGTFAAGRGCQTEQTLGGRYVHLAVTPLDKGYFIGEALRGDERPHGRAHTALKELTGDAIHGKQEGEGRALQLT